MIIQWILAGIAVLWVVAMWCIVIWAIKRGWGPYLRSKRQGRARVECTVSGKNAGIDELTEEQYAMLLYHADLRHNVLTFSCEDGEERDYEVRDDLFRSVEIGDRGILVYQGDLFVKFEPHRIRHDADKLYRQWTRG